jgi:hypothetical protein
MKQVLLLIFFLSLSFSHVRAQIKNEVKMTYFHKISFKNLLKAGESQKFVQLCTTKIDSVVQGTINFDKASVASIKNCKMSINIIADTIRSYKVETFNKKNSERLINQTIKVYGKSYEIKIENDQKIYIWREPFNNKQFIVSSLTVIEKTDTAQLRSKIE